MTVPALAVAAGLAVGAVLVAAPAQADPISDTFVNVLSAAGVRGIDPATAVKVGQSVCPMLVEPGQSLASVASKVADAAGTSLPAATTFTTLAISTFCPSVIASIGAGQAPFPLPAF